MNMITFDVPGKPSPQGSKVFKGVRGGRGILVESSKDLGPWRERVAIAAHNAMEGGVLISGAVVVRLFFVLPRPKATPKSHTPPAVKRPDLDKLSRACLDAITGVILEDDSQVIHLHAAKRIAELGEAPCARIQVVSGP
jgi:crossover junction endodeoxyribonuclease RusA